MRKDRRGSGRAVVASLSSSGEDLVLACPVRRHVDLLAVPFGVEAIEHVDLHGGPVDRDGCRGGRDADGAGTASSGSQRAM